MLTFTQLAEFVACEAAAQSAALPDGWRKRLLEAVGEGPFSWNHVRKDVCGRVKECLQDVTDRTAYRKLRPGVAARIALARGTDVRARLEGFLQNLPEGTRWTRADLLRAKQPFAGVATEAWQAGGEIADRVFLRSVLGPEGSKALDRAPVTDGRFGMSPARAKVAILGFLRSLPAKRAWSGSDLKSWAPGEGSGLGKAAYGCVMRLEDGNWETNVRKLLGEDETGRAALARNPYRAKRREGLSDDGARAALVDFLRNKLPGAWSPSDICDSGAAGCRCWEWLLRNGPRDAAGLAAFLGNQSWLLEGRPFHRESENHLNADKAAKAAAAFLATLPAGGTWSANDLKSQDAKLYGWLLNNGLDASSASLRKLLGRKVAEPLLAGRTFAPKSAPWSPERARKTVLRFLQDRPERFPWRLSELAKTGSEGRACADFLRRGGATEHDLRAVLGNSLLLRWPIRLKPRRDDAEIHQALENYLGTLPAGNRWTWNSFRNSGHEGQRCVAALMAAGRRLTARLAAKILGKGHPGLRTLEGRLRRDEESLRATLLKFLGRLKPGRAWSSETLRNWRGGPGASLYETIRKRYGAMDDNALASILGDRATRSLGRNPFLQKTRKPAQENNDGQTENPPSHSAVPA